MDNFATEEELRAEQEAQKSRKRSKRMEKEAFQSYISSTKDLQEKVEEKRTPFGLSLGGYFYLKEKKIYRLLDGVLISANDVKTIVTKSSICGGGTEEIPFNSHNWDGIEEEFIYLAATEAIEPLELALVEVEPTPVKTIVVVVKPQPPVKGRRSRKSASSQCQLALEV